MQSRRSNIDHADRGGMDDTSPAASMTALIDRLTGFVRRQYRVFLIVPAVGIILGLLYLLVTPAQYTASATLLIDSSPLRVLQTQQQQVGEVTLDTVQVGSQVEILGSEKIALAVIKQLALADDPDFIRKGSGIAGLFAAPATDATSNAELERTVLDEFAGHRNISRVERTYALTIAYTSRSPILAARIANAIAEAYINDQLDAKYQTIRRASGWLQDRISELKSEVSSADRAVLEYKEKNRIVDVGSANGGTGPGTQSRLIGEQQLTELNSQLSAARASTSEAKARLDRIEQVRKLDVGEAAVADTLRSEVITRLRNQYLDIAAREANWSSRYGSDHLAAVNLRNQMEELRRNIGAELGRVAASYRSDYEIARTREENLEQAVAGLVSEGQVTNRDRLGLTELESAAKIYHSVYDNFLQRYMEVIQQQSFPITDARVITAATPPTRKSKPIGSLVLAIAATLSMIASVGIAALREAVDGVFRTGRQIEQALGVKCLAVIPRFVAPATSGNADGRALARRAHPYAAAWRDLPAPADGDATPDAQQYAFADPLMRRVLDDHFSAFTEAFRAIKVTAELRAATEGNRVIGITSTLQNEGKSTVASNLATLMADSGKRVVLMDADLRNPTLARSLTPQPAAGLMDVLTGRMDLGAAVGRECTTGLAILPLVLSEPLIHSDEILSSPAFRNLIDQLRQRFDYVIMDLPPIAPVVDVRAAGAIIDSVVFVVEWGSTRIKAVQRHLIAEPELHDRLLGVVLNKADMSVLDRFEQNDLSHVGYYASREYRPPSY